MTHSQLLSSDESLRAAILALFAADARTASADLRVGVLNGIAHLAGTVPSLEVREVAEELAKSVRRVRGVVNRIEAPGGPSPARTVNLNLQNEGKRMNKLLNKIASALALVIGAMAVFAGGKVLLGILPDYYVINWLPIYNFIMGVVSLFLSIVIWKSDRFGMIVAIGILSLHAIVMLILQVGYRDMVAVDSIVAMSIRLAVWIVILTLLSIQRRKVHIRRAISPS
jgi:hypothetical protein